MMVVTIMVDMIGGEHEYNSIAFHVDLDRRKDRYADGILCGNRNCNTDRYNYGNRR